MQQDKKRYSFLKGNAWYNLLKKRTTPLYKWNDTVSSRSFMSCTQLESSPSVELNYAVSAGLDIREKNGGFRKGHSWYGSLDIAIQAGWEYKKYYCTEYCNFPYSMVHECKAHMYRKNENNFSTQLRKREIFTKTCTIVKLSISWVSICKDLN